MPLTQRQVAEIKTLASVVAEILRREGSQHLLVVQSTLNADDPRAFEAKICSLEWWGGSGSIFDYVPLDREATNKYMAALWQLCKKLTEYGLNCSWMSSSYRVLESWRKQGMFVVNG